MTIGISEVYADMGGYGLEDVILYGYFTKKSTHTITFVDNKDEGQEALADLESISVSDGSATGLLNYNTDSRYANSVQSTSYTQYFVGWYTTPTFDEGTLFTSEIPVTSDLTLYAKWENKVVITTTLEFGLAVPQRAASVCC